ncbi:MAG: hypothetical protein JWN08_1489 [Frankiales bacterium]|jgi:uncharacterized OB-fold protein|nr:hypothetical protein [Frankiales bacterium]
MTALTPPLPRLTPESDFYWTSGATGTLSLLRCSACGFYLHPPTPQCRACGSADVAPQPVSGRATLFTFTVSYQQLLPSIPAPYVVGIVALEEQDDVHITTRIVGVDLDEVRIGMPLQVRFEQHDDVYLPLFAPVPA